MHCKNPFEHTNKHKDFAGQVICILDHEEMMRQYDLYTMLHTNDIPLVNLIKEEEEEEIYMVDPTREWISQVLPSELRQIRFLSHNVQTALHVTVAPDEKNITLDVAMSLYNLLDFCKCYDQYLKQFVSPSNISRIRHSFDDFFLHHKLCMQLQSTFQPLMIMPSQTVQAKPPSNEYPDRCCDAVLISLGENSVCSHESWKYTDK
ncbi:hypothetical protein JVU11DRAFT_1233 [Chiua virens]|nr:hypothetical protein JVU11DRAFT_1233 [Chiua virens]